MRPAGIRPRTLSIGRIACIALAVAVAIPAHSEAQSNPVPALTSLSPSSAAAGFPPFTLTVNGSGFVSGQSIVWWNGQERPTTFVSATRLTAQIPTLGAEGPRSVTVVTSAPGGGTSNALTFIVGPSATPNPAPALTSLSPSESFAGAPAFILTVNGSGFVSGQSVVLWNGQARPTTFVNATRLTAQIPTLGGAGPRPVTVVTPAPGGGTSNAIIFDVDLASGTNNPVPSLTSLSPSSAVEGSPAFTLTVNGTGFVNGASTVVWNGVARTTAFVSSTRLTAQIPSLGGPGERPIVVVNSAPGGGTSNTLFFSVTSASGGDNPVPVLTSLQPSAVIAGGPGFTLTVNGSGFVNGASTVRWNGSARTTSFVSSTRLTAQITSADIQTGGQRPVTVVTGAPGGGTSNALMFTVSSGGAGGWTGTWTRMANAPFESRGWVDITFDDLNQRTVLFGGSGAQYRNDIRYYNAATDVWTLIEPNTPCGGSSVFYELHAPPTPRDEHAVEYDSHNHLYWTFGGSGFSCVNANRTAGAGTTTSVIVDPTLTQTTVDYYKDWTVGSGQEGRAYVNAYDAATKRLTLSAPIAGLAPGATYRLYPQRGGGTYFYSPATKEWQGLNRHWSYTGQTPQNRLSPAFAYSPLHRAMLMYGATGSYSADTWRLDVVTKTWSLLKASGAPGQPLPLQQVTNSMVYDRANDKFILFGGRCESCSPTVRGETWAYDLNTNTWTNMQPAVSPPARQQHTMVYDSVNHVVVAFAGLGLGGVLLNDTWVYHYPTNTWSQVSTPVAPSPRRLHSLAYDPVNQVSVTYGPIDVWQLELTPP